MPVPDPSLQALLVQARLDRIVQDAQRCLAAVEARERLARRVARDARRRSAPTPAGPMLPALLHASA